MSPKDLEDIKNGNVPPTHYQDNTEYQPKRKEVYLDIFNPNTLTMLQYEQMRRECDVVWKTKSGNKINIKDMTDQHLNNIIGVIERMEKRKAIREQLWDLVGDFDPVWDCGDN